MPLPYSVESHTVSTMDERNSSDDVSGDFQLINGRVTVDNLQTDIGNISISGRAEVNVITQAYALNADAPVISLLPATMVVLSVRSYKPPGELTCDGRLGQSPKCRPGSSTINKLFKNSSLDILGTRIFPHMPILTRITSYKQPAKETMDVNKQ